MNDSLFPPLWCADQYGLLATGGTVNVTTLINAYKNAIFPWPSGEILCWFSPPRRAILPLSEIHISRSMRKTLRKSNFCIYINRDFRQVINRCAMAKNRSGQRGTWITRDIIDGYTAMHQAGLAHSIECYDGVKLIGGLYGVTIGKMFAGESMFHTVTDASKVCLCFLIDYLRKKDVLWFDCQQMTPLLRSFGAIEVTREHFVTLLQEAIEKDKTLFSSSTQGPYTLDKLTI